LKSVDLPTFGRPTIPSFIYNPPCPEKGEKYQKTQNPSVQTGCGKLKTITGRPGGIHAQRSAAGFPATGKTKNTSVFLCCVYSESMQNPETHRRKTPYGRFTGSNGQS